MRLIFEKALAKERFLTFFHKWARRYSYVAAPGLIIIVLTYFDLLPVNFALPVELIMGVLFFLAAVPLSFILAQDQLRLTSGIDSSQLLLLVQLVAAYVNLILIGGVKSGLAALRIVADEDVAKEPPRRPSSDRF